MTIDPREFRNTVGCFATGITVITTLDNDGAPTGLTANSFTSVSLDPPMVLFCLDRKVASFESFAVGKPFAVNILSADQMDVRSWMAAIMSLLSVKSNAWPQPAKKSNRCSIIVAVITRLHLSGTLGFGYCFYEVLD